MNEPSAKPAGLRRVLAGSVNVLGWLGFGGALGWALSWSVALRDSPAHHHVALLGIIVAGLGLVTWVLGTRVLVGEVRRGVRGREGESPVQARQGLGLLLVPLAAPIIGMVIALLTISGGGGTGATRAVTGISAPAPEHARQTTPSTVDSEERTYVVRAGDRIQEIAARLYGNAADWVVIAKANKGRAEPDGARFVDPSVLRVGWTLLIPPLPDSEAPASHQPLVPATSSGEVGRDVALFGVLGGFGFLGACLFAARQRKRRRLQQLSSVAGMGPPLLEEDDARAEVELRALGDAELFEWIDAANRLLFVELVADRTITAPRVSIVRAGPNGLELLLEEPVERSTPSFQVRDGGHTWRLDPALELAEVRARAGSDTWAYLPGLIPFAEDDNGSYLVAVGAGESLGVMGEPDEIVRALGMIAVHLTSAPWGEVECYRVGPAEFSGAEPMIEITPAQVAGLDPGESVDPLWRAESFEAQPILFAQEPELATLAVERRRGIIAVIGAALRRRPGPLLRPRPGERRTARTQPALLAPAAKRAHSRRTPCRGGKPGTGAGHRGPRGAPGTLDRAAVTGSHRSAAPPRDPRSRRRRAGQDSALGAPVHRLSRCARRSCDNEQAARRDRLLPVRRLQIESVDLERRRSRSQGHRLAPHPAGGQPTAVHAEPGRDR